MSARALLPFLFVGLTLLSSIGVRAQVIDRVVAVVNSEIILASDLKDLDRRLSQPGLVDDLILFGRTREEVLKSQDQKIELLIFEKLIDSEVKRSNQVVTAERVEQEIREVTRRNQMTRAELVAELKRQGMLLSDFQDIQKKRIERQSLMSSEVSSRVRVSEEEVIAVYLQRNPGAKIESYEYALSHILFNPRKGGAEAAQKRAQVVLERLRAGEAFEVLAEQNSEDPSFSSGGALGVFRTGEFRQELEAVVSRLSVGEVSEPFSSRLGIQLVKVTAKKVVPDATFGRVSQGIRAELEEVAFRRHFRSWLENLRDESFVRINP